ncbi:calcineurin-like phosphoesterase family protein [Acuticoccus sp. MNP-M23]|uniref:calcineurin-like phosphoesterase family protein n=1 Tax=Acuticoccus sp. MNP-M23 TaxID=3072793 RepID=UPI002814EB81|nr:calcineurin-like phosphoesterase family protein [Acuticoccus sp. MNP-M23]WMS41084.1 calcineurin-like phosphoesterase family protein [Acuticoccus sp. MNP-M23]
MKLTLAALLAATAFSAPALAKDPTYIAAIDVVRGANDGGDHATGTVFVDANRNGTLDNGEAGIAGVSVSNGREVVATDADGKYSLPAYGDMNVFVTKPAGYLVPLDEDMIPQFNYVHKEAGSPPLRFGGIEPTGPLPQAINFPMIEASVKTDFKALVFGDPQPYNNREVGYVRDTVGKMLLERDLADVEFLLFEGDIMGDDLSLYPRFKKVIAVGNTPQYYVAGNHDLDLDATSDKDSFDTFRREFGPEYYAFDYGDVHLVVLDNVRYPCNGVDVHEFCAVDASPNYNGVIHDRQTAWLKADLANVPQDKLIIVNAHVPFQSFTDSGAKKHQTDNFAELAAIIGDRPALGLSGHTHTTENITPGEGFAGWKEATGLETAPFRQIITGAVSASWWAGDFNDQGVPRSTQRLGAPRGYYEFGFNGPDYTDTYIAFGKPDDAQLHASFNSPRFRKWAEALTAFAEKGPIPGDKLPPVTVNDLGDLYMLTRADIEGGTFVAVNVWNGSKDAKVQVSIDGGAPVTAVRTQPGDGEAQFKGAEYADPLAVTKQATQGRQAWRSVEGREETAGFQTWRGTSWAGQPGPFQAYMLARQSSHLWRADLPADLATGVHMLTAHTTDRHGRTFATSFTFEVVDELPLMDWNASLWPAK